MSKQESELREKILWLLYPKKGDIALRIMHQPLAEEIATLLDDYTDRKVREAVIEEKQQWCDWLENHLEVKKSLDK